MSTTGNGNGTGTGVGHRLVCCVDFGSTFTKAALVDLDSGRLLVAASHPTTINTDVLDGWDACRVELARTVPAAADAPVLACSSAGGGLRIAVVGNEALVTAEAGRRVALSSGGTVVHVASGRLGPPALAELSDSAPDVVLLVGGTDGGNAEVLLAATERLVQHPWRGPVVVAGNVAAQAEVAALLEAGGTPYVLADNVVPRIGVLAPEAARAAIREMFLRHVIGGKQLSARADFVRMVHGATPDIVLRAVELLAAGVDEQRPGVGDVVVVDVGGATSDVHSVVEPDPEDAGLARQVVAPRAANRTVEGDLGMRWSATTTVEEGLDAGLLPADDADRLRETAERRRREVSFLPLTPDDLEDDRALASAAVGVALRRHAGRREIAYGADGRQVRRTGVDLREVDLVVGSGGVLRHHGVAAAQSAVGNAEGSGWLLPRRARLVVDDDCVLAAAGLLAPDHPRAAWALLATLRGAGA